MTKKLITIVACLYTTLTLSAQDSLKINPRQVNSNDIIEVLNTIGISIYSFDLTPLSNNTYNVSLYVDEHEKGKDTKRIKLFHLGKNKELLSDLPNEQEFREVYNIPDDEKIWHRITDLSIYLRQQDSVTTLTFNAPQCMQASCPLPLHAIANSSRYFYDGRPYVLKMNANTDRITIPLIFYGSGWMDKSGMMRLCGEREIDTDSKEKGLLTHVPHYYTVGIELEKVK